MAYPGIVWDTLRAEYESGRYKSVADCYKKTIKNCQNISTEWPELSRVEIRSVDEDWTTSKEMTRQKFRELLVKQLMRRQVNPARISKVIDEDLLSAKKRVLSKDGDIVDLGADAAAIDRGLTQLGKYTGWADADDGDKIDRDINLTIKIESSGKKINI
jgi:hypothetical protein